VSLIALALIFATALALAAIHFWRESKIVEEFASPMDSQKLEARHDGRFPAILLGALTAVICFLLTPLSSSLWNYIPQAAYIQFPWRLLTILAPIFAVAIARALELLWGATVIASSRCAQPSILGLSLRRMQQCVGSWGYLFCSVALVFALTHPAIGNLRQPCRVNDTPPARLMRFQSYLGSRPTREYTPVTADNGALAYTNPPYWLANSADDPAPVDTLPGPAPMHLIVNAPSPEFLILNLRDYPSWRITRNGDPVAHPGKISSWRDDGLIAIQLPARSSTVDITYICSFDQSVGDTLSLIALALFAFLCVVPIRNIVAGIFLRTRQSGYCRQAKDASNCGRPSNLSADLTDK
jgi:hypothetical protein